MKIVFMTSTRQTEVIIKYRWCSVILINKLNNLKFINVETTEKGKPVWSVSDANTILRNVEVDKFSSFQW